MKRLAPLSLVLVVLFAIAVPRLTTGSESDAQLTPTEIESIATDAYVYFYPLVTMDITRLQSTNVAEPKGFSGPMNQLVMMREYPPADFRGVVRPNFDTLYSSLWMDLSEGPVVITLPASDGRYYMAPALDMWTNVFFSPGTRTTGNAAGEYAYVPPGWEGDLPEGVVRVDVPTTYCWMIGRSQTNGPSDYDAVHEFQNGWKVVPLAEYGNDSYTPPAGTVDSSIDMTTPPKTQVDNMSGQDFFEYAARLLKDNPPQVTDQGMIAQLRRLGFTPGEELDFSSLSDDVQAALSKAPAAGQKTMQEFIPQMARITNGWSMNTQGVGVYGNDFLKRSVLAQQGLGANLCADAIYPLLVTDGAGHAIAPGQAYVLHFEEGELPPVNAFWSVTLYDAEGFPVPNSIDRQAISSWMDLTKNADGSVDLYIQSESPGDDKEANWLPAPATGQWNLTMRLYSPQSVVAEGKWNPPGLQAASE